MPPRIRIFYYPGARFDVALLVQALVMVVIQVVLLKIALDNRPPPTSKGGEAAVPFARAQGEGLFEQTRPYNFWQWRSPKPYVAPSCQQEGHRSLTCYPGIGALSCRSSSA